MKIPDQIVMSAELRTELETMPAPALAAMSIADLKELGLGPVAALALRNAATSSAAVAVEEADPCMVVLQRLAGASAPSARLAAEAEAIHTGFWLVLSAEGKVTVEASAAELRRLRRALPEREVTTDGLRVVTPSRWAAVTAETVLIHPWKGTPLEDDGTDPHSGVSWLDEQLWLRAAVATPEAGLSEAGIAAQLKDPSTPWARAARARVEDLGDEGRSALLRRRKRKVEMPHIEIVQPITTAPPPVDREGQPVAPWAIRGTPFKVMFELLKQVATPAELRVLLMQEHGTEGLVDGIAWTNGAGTVIADLTDGLGRYGHAEVLLKALLRDRKRFEPEIRAVARAWQVKL